MKIVVGITGASGVIYGVKLLQALRACQEKPEVHLILSAFGARNLEIETDFSEDDLRKLTDYTYENHQLEACISSGSYLVDATVVIPCSMKTLSSVSNGYADTLIARVCDVALKEGRKLILCPRETPLNAIHLENMLKLSRLGVRLIPPMPAFYNRPQSIEDLVNHHVMKVMDGLQLTYAGGKRWEGETVT